MKFTNRKIVIVTIRPPVLNPLMWGNNFSLAARSLVHARTRTFSGTRNERLMNFKTYVGVQACAYHAEIAGKKKSNLEMYSQGRMRWNYERRRLLLMPVDGHFPQEGETNVVALSRKLENKWHAGTNSGVSDPHEPFCTILFEILLKGTQYQSNISSRKKHSINNC